MHEASRWPGRILPDSRRTASLAAAIAGCRQSGARLARTRILPALRDPSAWLLVCLDIAALLVFAAGLAGDPAIDSGPDAPPWLVLALFAILETSVVRLDIGGTTVALVLRATPTLVGFAYLPAALVVAAHVLGTSIAVVVRGGRAPVAGAWTVVGNALGTALAGVVFAALVPTLGGTPLGWWLAGCAVVITSNATGILWTAVGGPQAARTGGPGRVLRALGYTALASVVDTSLAITVVIFMRTDASELWLLAGPVLVATASYRAWTSLRRRHLRVEFLYECARLLDGPSSGAAMLDELLLLTRDALGAREAEILLDAAGDRRLRARVGPGHAREPLAEVAADPLRLRLLAVPPGARGTLLRHGGPVEGGAAAVGLVDAVVVRFDGEAGASGTLTVSGPTDGRPFESEDVRLLEALAVSLGFTLGSSRMIEELGASLADMAQLAAVVSAADEAVLGLDADEAPAAWNPGAALAGSRMGVGVIDGDFAWLRANDALGRLLGVPPAELVGRRFETALARDDIEAAHGLVSRVLRGERQGSVLEVRLRAGGERTAIVAFMVRPLRTPGHPIQALCMLDDITEQREAEERARVVEARVQDAILDLTAIREPDAVLRSVMRAARDVTGAVGAGVMLPAIGGEPPSAVCDGDTPPAMLEAAAMRTSDGDRRPVLVVPFAIDGATGRLVLIAPDGGPGFTDADQAVAERLIAQAEVSLENANVHQRALGLVRELDLANAALQEASEARSRFLANVSHELRTPLHAILIAARLLGDPSAAARDPARVARLPDTIEGSGRHLLGLIDDLVDLSRIEVRDLRLQVVELDLERLLDDVRDQAETLAAERRIRLTIGHADGIRVSADPLRLRQVLLNLLTNGIKYTEPDGRVHLSVHPGGATLRISVCDTGVGIAPDDLERAFQPFVRLVRDGIPGAGLGLPIARRIMELHGGTLVGSSMPGVGSTFTLSLPWAGDREPGPSATAVPAMAGPA